jgi:DNA-directed RNA polymerase specialized sigma24 family protein
VLRRYRREIDRAAGGAGSPEAAADAIQEATLLAYLHREPLADPASFAPWLTVALNGSRRSSRTSANFDDQTNAGPLRTIDRYVDEGRGLSDVNST